MMLHVLLALVPAALAHVWYFGPGFLFNLIVAAAFCVGGEILMVLARGRDPEIALSDYSALVTAALLAFALPSLTPWWVTATGAIFAVVVASAHRGDAFSACEFIMDFLKTRAPFWKREDTAQGARWVDARGSDTDAANRWQSNS